MPPRCDAVLAFEDSSGVIQEAARAFLAQRPEAQIEFAAAPPGQCHLVFRGKNAHGSQPWEGRNAARDAARFLAGLGLCGPRADFVRAIATLAEDDFGGPLGIAATHEFIGPATQNLGILTVGQGAARAVFNTRPTQGQKPGELLEIIRRSAAEAAPRGLEIAVEMEARPCESLFVDPARHSGFIGALQSAYHAVTGREPKLSACTGTTFAKAFPRAVCFGPSDPADEPLLAHQADERVLVSSALRNVRIYGAALALLAAE
ncbi:MAG: putative dipeptidase [candidate division BRC1 bacterium ADurb.BinA364]|nr:MAG: putative dipeptidase [candidate division BRC1 bacterium ADurb.BinA364]